MHDIEPGTEVTREVTLEYFVFEEGFRIPEKVDTMKAARLLKRQTQDAGAKSWILQRRVEATTITTVEVKQ